MATNTQESQKARQEVQLIATLYVGKNKYDEKGFSELTETCKKWIDWAEKSKNSNEKKAWEEVIKKVEYLKRKAQTLNADLSNHPPENIITEPMPGAKLVLGDLHGNWLKFVWILIAEGVLKLKNGAEDYNTLYALYMKSAQGLLSLKENQIIDDIFDKATWREGIDITLLGDETGDRGFDDIKTLKILQKLNQKNINVEILFSDHGAEFIYFYDMGCRPYHQARNLGMGQARSVENVGRMIGANQITSEEVSDLIQTNYLPLVKLFSYTIDYDSIPNHISLFSHAAVFLNTIYAAAQKFGVLYKDDTVQDLAATIDKINEKFYEKLKNKAVSNLLIQEERTVFNHGHTYENATLAHPLIRTTWNRYAQDKSHGGLPEVSIVLDHQNKKKAYLINTFHGHDQHGEMPDYIERLGKTKNLDDDLGKYLGYDGWEKGVRAGQYKQEYRRYVNFEQGSPPVAPRLKAAEEALQQEKIQRKAEEEAFKKEKREEYLKNCEQTFKTSLNTARNYKVQSRPFSTTLQRIARTAELRLLEKMSHLIDEDKSNVYIKLEVCEKILLAISNDLRSEYRYGWKQSDMAVNVHNLLRNVIQYKNMIAETMPVQFDEKEKAQQIDGIMEKTFQDQSETPKYKQILEEAHKPTNDLYRKPGKRSRGE